MRRDMNRGHLRNIAALMEAELGCVVPLNILLNRKIVYVVFLIFVRTWHRPGPLEGRDLIAWMVASTHPACGIATNANEVSLRCPDSDIQACCASKLASLGAMLSSAGRSRRWSTHGGRIFKPREYRRSILRGLREQP